MASVRKPIGDPIQVSEAHLVSHLNAVTCVDLYLRESMSSRLDELLPELRM